MAQLHNKLCKTIATQKWVCPIYRVHFLKHILKVVPPPFFSFNLPPPHPKEEDSGKSLMLCFSWPLQEVERRNPPPPERLAAESPRLCPSYLVIFQVDVLQEEVVFQTLQAADLVARQIQDL